MMTISSHHKSDLYIIFFDNICTLCHRSVKLLISLDTKQRLRYSSLQGDIINSLIIDKNIDSIIFYDNGDIYYKSTAILKLMYRLGGVYKLLSIFYIMPRIFRDFIYDRVAKHRYKIFGKLHSCILPKESEKGLFIP